MSKSKITMFLLVFIICLWLSKGYPKFVYVKENRDHELSYLVQNHTKNEQRLVWVKDSDKNVNTDCGIYSLECINHESKSWLQATVERVNTSLLFRLLLMNVTRENAEGTWKLMSHNTMPNRILYYSLEIKVYEPIDLAFTNRWSNYGLIIECTHSSASPSIKMTVTLGPSNNLHVPSNHTRAIPVCHGAQCHVMVPKEDLTCGTSTLVVYVYPNLTNSDDDLIYGTKFISTLNLENPQVKIACSNNTPGLIVCTCDRTDSSNVTTEFTWRVNNLIQHSQPGLDIWHGSHNSVITLDLKLPVGLQEISCQAINVFGWKSRVELYKLDQKVLLATTIRELELMSANTNTSVDLTATERIAASRWRREVFKVSLGAVIVLFLVCMLVFSYDKCVLKAFCRRRNNNSN